MNNSFTRLTRAAIALSALLIIPFTGKSLSAAERSAQNSEPTDGDGFKSLFNGTDLTGWEGLPQFWSVKEGALTGQTTKENPAKGNTFLIWKGGEVSDFELRLSFKITADNDVGFANSGIQYRSKIADPSYFVVGGYQADMEAGKMYSGILYEERGRGILAQRGQKVVIHPGTAGKPNIEVVGSLGSSAQIQAKIKPADWNEYIVIAKGNHLQHFINGMQTVDIIDEDSANAAKSGILALQLHAGQPMTVQFKNIRIKQTSNRATAQMEHLQGDWIAEELIDNGEHMPASALAALKLKIQGNQFSLNHPDGLYQGKFEIKEATGPMLVDIQLDDGTEVPGICDIGAEKLKLCYAQPGSSRPTTFKSTSGSENVVAVYQRANR